MSLAAYATRGSFDRLWSERVERARRNRRSRRRFDAKVLVRGRVFGPLMLPEPAPLRPGSRGRRHDDLHRRHDTGPEHRSRPGRSTPCSRYRSWVAHTGASTVDRAHAVAHRTHARVLRDDRARRPPRHSVDDAREHVGIGHSELAADRGERVAQRHRLVALARHVSSSVMRPGRDAQAPFGRDAGRQRAGGRHQRLPGGQVAHERVGAVRRRAR